MAFRSTVLKIMIASLVGAASILSVLFLWAQNQRLDLVFGNLVVRTQVGAEHGFPSPSAADLDEWAGWTRSGDVPRAVSGVDAAPAPVSKVIIMMADGMGLGMLATTSHLAHGPAGGFAIESAPVTGFARVAAANNLVPDSGAAGTAMATGFKTNKKMVSTLPDGRRVQTLHEAAKAAGMATAVVTTSYLTDATPACFSTHAAHRNRYGDILMGMSESGIDVFIGGETGIAQVLDEGGDALQAITANYGLVRTPHGLQTATLPLFGVFPQRPGGDSNSHGPMLAESLARVLQLFADREAFVMLVETEITDGEGHKNRIDGTVDAVREFDAALEVALRYADGDPGTLVLALADHDTGGPAVTSAPYEEGSAAIRWVTDGHTAEWVPVFAFGTGAEVFSGVQDLSDVPIKLARLLGISGFPMILDGAVPEEQRKDAMDTEPSGDY